MFLLKILNLKQTFCKRSFTIVFSFIIFLTFSSCHSTYLNISTDYSYKYAWKSDSSKFAFVAINRIYRMPAGIAKFPDGGMSKTEYFDIALYYYDLKNEKLNRIVDFKDYFILYPGKNKYQYIDLAFDDSLIFYKLSNPSAFDIITAKRHVHSDKDSIKLMRIIDKVSEINACNIKNKKIIPFNSLPSNIVWADRKSYNFLKDIRKNLLKKISYSDWGINLKNIYLQSEKKYENYIVYKEGNELMRNAVLEQIISQYQEEKILKIINRMKKHKKELEEKAASSVNYKNNVKKDAYNEYYSKTTKILKNMIQTKKLKMQTYETPILKL